MAAGLLILPGAQPSRSRNGGAVIAELRFYDNNTSDPKTVYADEGLTTPLSFPVVSDDAGRFVLIWAEAGTDESPNLFTVNWATQDGQVETWDDIRPATAIIDGAAATIAVGTTTTLTAGNPATVTNSGSSSAAVFNFGIPAGPAATVTTGTTTTSSPGGSASVTNSGTTSAAVFDFTIPRGSTGPAPNLTIGTVVSGPTADADITGTNPDYVLDLTLPQGDAATIEVGTVTTGAAGTPAVVTNVGTDNAAIFDFTIPQGSPGMGNVSSTGTITANDVAVFQDASTIKAGVPATIRTTIGAVAKSGDTMTGPLILSADPVTALGAATKQYVDAVASGLIVKASVTAATTANITLSGAQTIDGVSVVAGNRVLVKNQSTSSQNGIYVAASGAWSRATDADTWAELVSAFTFVEQGTVNADTGWVCTVDPGGTLGSTAVTWVQFSSAGVPAAGNGLTQTGLVFAIDGASASDLRVGTSTAKVVTPKSLYDAAAFVSLTDATTIAVDMATFLNAQVTLGGSRTLGAPSNAKEGQSGIILVTQDGTGSRTLAYASAYKFAGGTPTLSTAAGAVDGIAYVVRGSNVYCSFLKGFA